MNRFPTPDERWPRRGEPLPEIVHDKCGTPDCCQQCAPVQLEFNFEKDTNEKPLSFDGWGVMSPVILIIQQPLTPDFETIFLIALTYYCSLY